MLAKRTLDILLSTNNSTSYWDIILIIREHNLEQHWKKINKL